MQIVGYDTGAPPVADPEDLVATAIDRGPGEPTRIDVTGGHEPALLVSTDGTVERVALTSGRELSYALGERHCAGVVDGDRHVACERPTAPYCDGHTSTWVCARCTGTCLKDEMDCYEAHAVYLAAFAPATFKVGVTRSWRLPTRLAEQGADRAVHLRTVSNGRIAREIEADIAAELGDRVRISEKIAGLSATVEEDAWWRVRDAHDPIAAYDLTYGLDLAARPVAETLATGTVRGVKGRVLVLDNGGSVYAVDCRELIGHELDPGDSDRQLQSSLGAFG